MKTPATLLIALLFSSIGCTTDVASNVGPSDIKTIGDADGIPVVRCWLEEGEEHVRVMCDTPQSEITIQHAGVDVLSDNARSVNSGVIEGTEPTQIIGLPVGFVYPVEVRVNINFVWPEGVNTSGSFSWSATFRESDGANKKGATIPIEVWPITIHNALENERIVRVQGEAVSVALEAPLVHGSDSNPSLEIRPSRVELHSQRPVFEGAVVVPVGGSLNLDLVYRDRNVTHELTGPGEYWVTDEGWSNTAPGATEPEVPATSECDPSGDNGGPDAATVLSGSVRDQLCAGEEDWFLVDGSGETVTATIQFDHAAGDLDLETYDSSASLVGGSEGSENTEVVAAATPYYLKVIGYEGATNSYEIWRE